MMWLARMWSSLSSVVTFISVCPGLSTLVQLVVSAQTYFGTWKIYAFRKSILFGVSHRCLYWLSHITQSLTIAQGIVTRIRFAEPFRGAHYYQFSRQCNSESCRTLAWFQQWFTYHMVIFYGHALKFTGIINEIWFLIPELHGFH